LYEDFIAQTRTFFVACELLTAARAATGEVEGAGEKALKDGADDAGPEGGDGFPGAGFGGGNHGKVDDWAFSGSVRK
jgi:hypothetical protein